MNNDSDRASRSLDELGGVSRGCSERHGHRGKHVHRLGPWQKTTQQIRMLYEMAPEQQARRTLCASFYLGCFYLECKLAGHKTVALKRVQRTPTAATSLLVQQGSSGPAWPKGSQGSLLQGHGALPRAELFQASSRTWLRPRHDGDALPHKGLTSKQGGALSVPQQSEEEKN